MENKCTSLPHWRWKKSLQGIYMDIALVHCYWYCHVYVFVCMYTQMLPSKLEGVLPHDTTKVTVKLWHAGLIIQYTIQQPGISTAVFSDSSEEPGQPSAIHVQQIENVLMVTSSFGSSHISSITFCMTLSNLVHN